METKPTPAEFLEKKYNGTIPEQGFTTAAHVMENMRDYSADLLAKVSEQEKEIAELKEEIERLKQFDER